MPNKTKTQEEAPKKRGRKPSKNGGGYYFGAEQEKAVVDYLSTDDAAEKDRIFRTVLKPSFTKMIESIIRRYNLYPPDEEFNDTFNDTMSFLLTKLSYFDPSKNYKAYSYCGTICKNYLIYKINQFTKNQKRNVSYDNPYDTIGGDLNNNISFSYNESNPAATFLMELTGNTVSGISHIIENREESKLNDNEVKVGKALINLMNEWDEVFAQMGSNKFNKSSIILYLKEATMLSTKEVRESIKVFKKKYYEVKKELIEG